MSRNKQKIQIFIDAQQPLTFSVEGLRKGQQLEVYDTYGMATCENWPGEGDHMPLVVTEIDVPHPHMLGQTCTQKITVMRMERR